MPAPTPSHMFVRADSVLAEHLCHVEVLDMTESRATVLHSLHRDHSSAECLVVTAAELHLP